MPMRMCLPIAFCFLLFASQSYGQKLNAERTFSAWDRNGDNFLSKDELPERARSNFGKADGNSDGRISLDKHIAFLQRRRPTSRNSGLAGLKLKTDIPYAGSDNPRQMLDLVLPESPTSKDPLPVIAFIHGGGWRKGSRASGIAKIAPFVRSGRFAGVTIGYRLSDEVKWPAQIHDCKAAIRWIRANAAEHNFDPDLICVFGTSAGGHLVAMLGVTGDVQELEGDLGHHTDKSSRVAGVIDFFGPANFLSMNDAPGKMDHDAPDSPESLLIGAPIQEHREKTLAACPVSYVTSDDAPILIMHGSKDPLVPYEQSVEFEKLLREAGVSVTLVKVVDAGHGFTGDGVTSRVRQFVDHVLLGLGEEVSAEPVLLKN